MKKLIGILILTCILFLGCSDDDNTGPDSKETIKIGALLPLSGNFAQHGTSFLHAIQIAISDVNTEFENLGSNTSVELVYYDTETNADLARIYTTALIGQGIRFIIGPMTSNELEAVKVVADASDCIIISPGSTMIELAEDDNIFRLVPNDSELLDAVLNVMEDGGVQNLAVIHLTDSWGSSLAANIETMFTGMGGNFLGTSGFMTYRPADINSALDSISTLITTNLTPAEYEDTAIFTVCFDEGTMILDYAGDYDALPDVGWYCCDGYVNNEAIFDSTAVAALQFAIDTEFRSTIFGIDETADYLELKARIELAAGQDVNNYAIISYDATQIAIDVLEDLEEGVALSVLKQNFITAVSGYAGVSGIFEIDANGDRVNGRYDFWGLNDTPEWFIDFSYEDGAIVNP